MTRYDLDDLDRDWDNDDDEEIFEQDKTTPEYLAYLEMLERADEREEARRRAA